MGTGRASPEGWCRRCDRSDDLHSPLERSRAITAGSGQPRSPDAALPGVVVDNASADGSLQLLEREFPWVEVVRMDRNEGFGVALNRATAAVEGDPLLFLNDDAECEPGFVAGMLAAADGTEMVAGVLLQEQRPDLIDSAGIIADAGTLMAFDYLHGEPVEAAESVEPPFGPSGACPLHAGGVRGGRRLRRADLPLLRGPRPRPADAAHGGRCSWPARPGSPMSALPRWVSEPGRSTSTPAGAAVTCCAATGSCAARPRLIETICSEAAVCAGQVLLDHSAKGIVGRVKGWRAAAGLEQRELPRTG